jgi:uncharacterized membrane protein
VRASPLRHATGTILSPRRAGISLVLGVLAGAVVAPLGAPELGPLVAWIVATSVALTWVWLMLWPQDHYGTELLAEAESRSPTTDTAVLIASVVSLGAVVMAFVISSGREDGVSTVTVVLSVVEVVLSWALVNTVFALKYARLYYLDEDGGMEFTGGQPPAYSDFAYVAFTVGMTFAVAETAPATAQIRKVALGHALLSYLFGTGILAVAINLVTNLAQS